MVSIWQKTETHEIYSIIFGRHLHRKADFWQTAGVWMIPWRNLSYFSKPITLANAIHYFWIRNERSFKEITVSWYKWFRSYFWNDGYLKTIFLSLNFSLNLHLRKFKWLIHFVSNTMRTCVFHFRFSSERWTTQQSIKIKSFSVSVSIFTNNLFFLYLRHFTILTMSKQTTEVPNIFVIVVFLQRNGSCTKLKKNENRL